MHFHLRFKHQLCVTLVHLAVYLHAIMPSQLAASEFYGQQHAAQQACKSIDAIVMQLVPTVDYGIARLCEYNEHASKLVAIFLYIAIALLITLNWMYWEVGRPVLLMRLRVYPSTQPLTTCAPSL